MTTEDLMKLAENYARLCYEGDDGPFVINARQALLDALEAQGREVERMGRQILSDTDAFIHVRDQRDALRAELAAIRAQEPVGYVSETTWDMGVLEKDCNPGTPLFASPADKDAGLVADEWKLTVRDLIVSNSMNASCQAGLVPRCICVKCATKRAEYMLAASPKIGGV